VLLKDKIKPGVTRLLKRQESELSGSGAGHRKHRTEHGNTEN